MSQAHCKVPRSSLLLALTLLLCSCTTFRAMDPHDARTQLLPGQTVRVTTEEGQTMTFKVRSLTDESLIGSAYSVRYADVRGLERGKINWLKTFGLTSLGIGLFGLIASQATLNFDGIAPGS